jgi:hypothetical protein
VIDHLVPGVVDAGGGPSGRPPGPSANVSHGSDGCSPAGDGVELEAPGDVIGEDAESLPGAVGAVVTGGDDIERELTLEFAVLNSSDIDGSSD